LLESCTYNITIAEHNINAIYREAKEDIQILPENIQMKQPSSIKSRAIYTLNARTGQDEVAELEFALVKEDIRAMG